MDYLRSCYRTWFRFFEDDDTPTLVEWFFTDKPMLPFSHSYGSLNWTGESDTWDYLGEIKGADRIYSKGGHVGDYPTNHICGTPGEWITGESRPPDPQTPVTADYVPLCCLDTYDSRGWQAAWNRERQFNGQFAGGIVLTADWNRARQWTVNGAYHPTHLATWARERQVESHSRDGIFVAPLWGQKRDLSGSITERENEPVSWEREQQWTVTVQTGEEIAAAWSRERSWTIETAEEVDSTADWDRERQTTVVVVTDEVVTSFDCGAQVAAGTTQGTATLIAHDTVSGTTTGANQGFILPAGCYRIVVWNANAGGGNSFKIYPPSGAQILGLGTNNPATLNPQFGTVFVEITATLWRTINLN